VSGVLEVPLGKSRAYQIGDPDRHADETEDASEPKFPIHVRPQLNEVARDHIRPEHFLEGEGLAGGLFAALPDGIGTEWLLAAQELGL
jgi:hypothetical protein